MHEVTATECCFCTPRMIMRYSLMALFFALGKFSWANHIGYEFGGHDHLKRRQR